ncbi:hypothetical protein PF005_g15612 [Phytophthora fragariae]|uniref:Uncharacterized protein n=1 Tax=Phytophthora fragariae TaxID=53985 RepID=A0A6A3K498_9STRA|nr:hypothetical protein PF003_g5153 [Phytophthora fragariae]KAE8933184.1 hypothetical protein PF009_g16800 [Phytophthora fragariae]KAE8999525.1 hypothetical protein PF011_g14588 [Phytophthora fragariae]KAE9099430.1 hypothetical protein PF007_g15880 [Phytophthora fragariae]KAE9099560.1 hypothetical protein PF010_g15152 [Phytophthora fragariae]
MWASEAGLDDDDPREIQRRREVYARELDHQIALRRARQHQEQMEREDLERKLAPSERSPSKWLVEGGHLDTPAAPQSPWKFTQSVDIYEEQQQDRGAATGEANGVSSSHPRFRVTDESETSQRLRERAQQMQWKRMLDEQVQEKARLKEHQETERRRSEEDAAREEMRYLREQQLRAQRRLGQFSPGVNAEFSENRTDTKSPYHALPSPPEVAGSRQRNDFQQGASSRHNFAFNSDNHDEDDKFYQRDRQYGNPGASEALLPPPAPSRIQMPQGNSRTARDDSRGTFDPSAVSGIAGRLQENDAQESRQQLEQQSRIIDEYRSLLAEIRREREELRRERDEVRREKEELRVQRALLQLENEKMASLVDAQRALNEQHHADLQTQQVQQAQQLAQQQAQQQQYQHAVSFQHRLSPVQSTGFDMSNTVRNTTLPDHSEDIPEAQSYSRLNQIRQTLGDLNIHEDQSHPAVQGRRRKPPSPMSMADFSTPTPNKRMVVTAMDSPRFQRLSRYRPIPAVPAHDESVLNQSLVGESVFVPLSPKSQNQDNNGPAPRVTASPTSADRRGDTRANSLRSSRVIKSRGFYDFDQELKSDKLESFASGSIRDSFGSDIGSSLYGDDDDNDISDAEDELFDAERSSDSRPATSSGLFQVQVLV